MNLNISRELTKLDNILIVRDRYKDDSDIQKMLINDALIYVYTFYEQNIKKIYVELYDKYEASFKSNPLIIGHKCKEPKWVAPTKSEELIKSFPLLKEWHFFSNDINIKKIDSLISCRHEYAHNGNTQIVLEDIYVCFFSIIRIINFLREFYLRDGEKEIIDKKLDFLSKDLYIYDCYNKLEKKFYTQIYDKQEFIPKGLKQSFNNLNDNILDFITDCFDEISEDLSSLLILDLNTSYEDISVLNIDDDLSSSYFNKLLIEYKRCYVYKFPMYNNSYNRIVLREYMNDPMIRL